MTQEEKQLLIKDLCARAPYRPKVKVLHVWNEEKETEEDIVDTVYCVLPEGYINTETIDSDIPLNDNVILYLRPMFSMTEEEYKEYSKLWDLQDEFPTDADIRFKIDVFDWLNSHHFDFRNLIGKGLAIDCTNLNIY